MIPTALRTFGLARASDLEAERDRGRFMEATLTSYSACIDRLTAENKTLREQNMVLVRDAVAAKLDPPPFSGGAERVRESLERAREDQVRFRASLDRIYEARRAADAARAEKVAKVDPPPVISTKGYDTSGKGDGGPDVWPPAFLADTPMTLPPHPDWVNPDGSLKPVPDVPEEATVVPLPRSPRSKRKPASQVGPVKMIGGE